MLTDKSLKIILVGGGTGGHLIPIFPVALEMTKLAPKSQLLLISRQQEIKSNIVLESGLETRSILAGKWRRYFSWQNFSDLFLVTLGFFQSLGIIWKFKPDIIFSKGGFVSVPVILAGLIFKVPIVAHESDVISGVSNKIAARWAKKIACGFEKRFYLDLPQNKLVFTGNPLREEMIEEAKKLPARTIRLGKRQIETKLPLLLIVGASQGAHRINELIRPSLEELLEKMIIVHISGRGDYGWLENESKKLSPDKLKNYYLFSYLSEELPAIMNRADLVISRTGASSLTELAILKKAAIVIPLSTSASNHQWHNAQIFNRENAVYLIDERKADPLDLKNAIEELLNDKKRRETLSHNIRQFAHPDAAKKIAEIIIETAQEGKSK